MNIPEFIAKIIILVATYYITLEYVVVCEVQTWIGCLVVLFSFIAVTVLYMIFRAGNVKICKACGKGM